MNDITYTLNQTNRERKSLVPSAMKRTRGSKSKKCSLPSDNLTPSQMKRMNGPVHTYNLTVPMSWDTFKEMPLDLQEKYILSLYDRFHIGPSTIGEELFDLSHHSLSKYCRENGISYRTRQGRFASKDREVFRAWVNGGVTEDEPILLTNTSEPVETVEPVEPVETVSSVEPVETVETVNPSNRNTLTLATLHMAGSAEDVIATLRNFLTCDGKVELEVTINFKEENK